MKYLINKSKRQIKILLNNELLRHRLLILRRYYFNDPEISYKIQYLLSQLNKSTKVFFRCSLTNYSRIYRLFRVSRIAIRSYGGMGHFVGLKKSSW